MKTGQRSHVWQHVGKNVWQCPICFGYAVSWTKPDPEAIARTEVGKATKIRADLAQLQKDG